MNNVGRVDSRYSNAVSMALRIVRLLFFEVLTAEDYCNFAYSARTCFRSGMPGSASFQSARKS
jgi:hypothetical protein